jgi:AraC-like DNA-binding protein
MWRGQARIEPGWAVFYGRAGDHVPHQHHAVQVALGERHSVKLWVEDTRQQSAPGVVIAADRAHRLGDDNGPLVLLYLERESVLGRTLDDWCGSRSRPLSRSQSRRLIALLRQPSAVTSSTLVTAVGVILESAPPASTENFSDARITRVLAALPRPLPEGLSAADLAREAGLSTSHFAHLFSAHAGMPLRPYLRWLRLQQALVEIARGSNLTDAAHTAGFSDSAHLSRTFRRTFGIAPRVLLDPALRIGSQEPRRAD